MGSPEGNWFRWLEGELFERGYNVWLPELPRAEKPSLAEWREYVLQNCPFDIDGDTMIVGHSSGAILALIVAQSVEEVSRVIAVSVFHDNSLNWDANSRLFDVEFDWQKLAAIHDKFTFIHSDNDPYVSLDQAQFVANKCGAELVLIPNQGHFNLEFSPKYREFPELLTYFGL